MSMNDPDESKALVAAEMRPPATLDPAAAPVLPFGRAIVVPKLVSDGRDLALADIEPIHIGAYVKALGEKFEKPTVKQHLAAIKMLFDWLVVGQIIGLNPTMPCVARNTSSSAVRRRCSRPIRRASCSTPSI